MSSFRAGSVSDGSSGIISDGSSLGTLLTGIVDYAGLFPPAGLSLSEAIHNYSRYREQPEAWMLGRFICPASRLEEVSRFANLFSPAHPFLFSVLAREALEADLDAITRFREQHGQAVQVEGIEFRLPSSESATFLPRALHLLSGKSLVPFAELPLQGNWQPSVIQVVEELARHQGPERPGFKIRCGGEHPSAIPSVEQLAFVLHTCVAAGVPLKATAGLHHPFRHFSEALGTPMHGFVNLLVAGVLGHARRLEEEELREVLADGEPAHFLFAQDSLTWREHRVTLAEIARGRQQAVLSFGSCSFDEPRSDLRSLGLLGGTHEPDQ
jgi:hypothetical protein